MGVRGRVTISERDKGWGRLKSALGGLKDGGSYVKVGMIGEKAQAVEHDGTEPLTNVALMAMHEFGTDTLPERSVIRRAYDENHDRYVEMLKPLVRGIYEGRTTAKKALEIVGFAVEWDMKNLILQGLVEPPDSPATVKRKMAKSYKGAAPGAPRTLIDTGRLVAAISHLVVVQSSREEGEVEQIGSATLVKE